MAKDLTKIEIGDVDLFIDYGDGEISLGHTKGGAEFEFIREFEELTVDQHGEAVIDMALRGNNLKIKTFLAQPTRDNLARAIPEGSYQEGVGGDSRLGLGRDSGYLLSQDAGLLRLHPRNRPADDHDKDIYIWKAVSVENIPLNYKIDEQRLIEVTYQALVDDSQDDGYRLGRIGDFDIS